jgi:hypothetical protein
MTTFHITLGNTDFTAGHRYRCAHVAVTFEVKAKDEASARAKLKAHAEAGTLMRKVTIANIEVNAELAHTGPCKEVG